MTILGTDTTKYKKNTHSFFLLIALVSVAAIVLNVLLAVFRTDNTHIAFMIINIIFDIATVWSIFYIITIKILPRKRLFAFYERGKKGGKEQKGTVVKISENTMVVQGFDCYSVLVVNEDKEIELYLMKDMPLEVGGLYKFGLVENIIYQAEVFV